MLKRLFDFITASLGLVILSPLLILIAGAIKLTSKGSVFYKAPRVGRFGKPFTMYKFRTMVANADQIGGASTADGDSRVTKVGAFLRRFKLDEPPQFINVMRGEMSIVGPRPNVQFDVDMYTKEERAILSVRPGITDFASIKYSNEGEILEGAIDADEAYNRLIRPGKIFLQLRYIREQSFLTDLRIIYMTLVAIALVHFGAKKPQFDVPAIFVGND